LPFTIEYIVRGLFGAVLDGRNISKIDGMSLMNADDNATDFISTRKK
jgi:hypothetical protein